MAWPKTAGKGRPPGSRNKATREREYLAEIGAKEAKRLKRSPLQVLLARMDGDKRVTDEQFAAAAAAAPYVHPRLAATESTIRSDNVHRVLSDKPISPEEWMLKHAPKLQIADEAAATDISTEDNADNADNADDTENAA